MKRLLLILMLSLFLYGCGSSSNSPKAISVTLSPSTQTTLDQGQSLAFTATVSNDSANKGVTWAMDGGAACTAAGCGTFTNSTATGAMYNTPASVTSGMTVTVTATSVSDTSKTTSSKVVVNPALSVSNTSLSSGTVGVAYSSTLTATGGSGSHTWSMASGSSLPAGLTLSGSGAISGTPTATGTSNFTVKVTDSASTPVSATAALSITINNPVLAITTTTLADGVVGVAYNQTVASSGGAAPITWSWSAATVPPGFQLGTSGASTTISGNTTTSGSYTFTVTATDSSTPAQTKSQTYTVNIVAALGITTTSVPSGSMGTSYNQTIGITGGTAPFSWSYSGTLPAGLSFSSGTITGTPTSTGTSSFNAKVTDSSSPPQIATQSLRITINGAIGGTLSITTTTLPAATVGSPYAGSVIVSGGNPPYTYSISPVSPAALPSWLSFDTSAGVISGSPTAQGTVSFTVSVADSTQPTAQTAGPQSLSITINAAQACTSSGNESILTGPYVFSLSGFNSTGFLAVVGSLTADGKGNITAGEADTNGALGVQAGSIDTTSSSYSVGSDNRGCATIVTSFGTFTTRFALGQISSGAATDGRMVEWETGSSAYVGTGAISQQTANATPSGSYAFAESGVNGSNGRMAILGVVSASNGSITSGESDMNVEGNVTNIPSFTGTYTNPDANGRFTTTTMVSGSSHNTVDYMVTGSQFVFITTDAASQSGTLAGQMKQQSGTFSNSSASGNVVAYLTGLNGGGSGGSASIALVSANGATPGSLTGTTYYDGGGTLKSPGAITCSYSVAANGRMSMSGCGNPNSPVIYLYATNKGYFLTGDSDIALGQIEPQTGGPFTASSASGNFYMGSIEAVNQNTEIEDGVITLNASGAGSVSTTHDTTSTTYQGYDGTDTDTITVGSDGTVISATQPGVVTGLAISSTKIVIIDNTSGTYPTIAVIKQQ